MLIRDTNIRKSSDKHHSNKLLDRTINNYSDKTSVALCNTQAQV